MKREHTQDSYIDWLKSIGCLVYLPLGLDDTRDYISNTYLQNGTGSFTYNASKQMYQFTVPSYNGSAAILRNGFDKTWFSTNAFTFCAHFRKFQTISGMRTLLYNIGNTNSAVFNIGYNGTSNLTNFPSDYHYAHSFSSNRELTIYQQGEFCSQGVVADSNQFYNLPSSWNINQNNKGLWIGCYNGQSTVGSYCMGEIYIFDGVLDLTTIRKIQGYEQ